MNFDMTMNHAKSICKLFNHYHFVNLFIKCKRKYNLGYTVYVERWFFIFFSKETTYLAETLLAKQKLDLNMSLLSVISPLKVTRMVLPSFLVQSFLKAF